MQNRYICLVGAALGAVALTAHGQTAPVPTGFAHVATGPRIAFEAEQPFATVDSGGRGYRLANAQYVGNSSGGAIVPNGGLGAAFVQYRITFSQPGTYALFHKLSLLPLNGGNPEVATSYDNHNSVFLPRALNQIPGALTGDNTLTTFRKNLFSNSQWPFPHNGNYGWSTTESIIYHNYSVFPAHELLVTPAMVGTPQSLFITARETGWAIDRIALVEKSTLGVWGDNAYHPQFDGAAWGLMSYNHDHNNDGVNDSFDFEKLATGVGDGIPDAVYAPASHFAGGWNGITPFALDYVSGYVNGIPVGDTHADTAIDINKDGIPDFETHFAGQDPDLGATPLFLDSLFEVPGDTNFDGDVDFDDLGQLLGNYGQPGDWLGGDFDYTGVTDFDDLGLLLGNYSGGASAGLASFEQIVPEPAGLAWMLLATIVMRRTRRTTTHSFHETAL